MIETRKVVPLRDWPATDRAAWIDATDMGDIFSEAQSGRRLNDRSLQSIATGYGRWVGFLHAHAPEAFDDGPAERVSRERVRDYVDLLVPELSSGGLWNYVRQLHQALTLMAPKAEWAWLKDVVSSIERSHRPKAKRHLLVEADRLVDLGLNLMKRAGRGTTPFSPKRATDYRDGLLIAFLALRPIRRRSLALMAINRHLIKTGEGYSVSFESRETKTREPLEFTFPALLVQFMDRYLVEVRPAFPGASNHPGLWASTKGGPMNGDALNLAVKRRTKAAFGHAIHLHLFRDCAATTIAVHDPAHIGAARDLLGHKDLRTTERFYNQACALEAGRQYHEVMANLRDRLTGNHGPGRPKKE